MVKDKVVIVTGAASGIGKEIAKGYAKEGAKVILADINAEAGFQVKEEIENDGHSATFIQTDVSSPESMKDMIDRAASLHGRIDVLVNNAGLEYFTTVEDTTLEQWDHTMNVNLKGVFLGTKYVLPYMKTQEKGSIINMASVAAVNAWPGLGVYSAAKGGIVLLTKAAAAENGKYGIRVNCICPGSIRTPLLETQFFGAQEDPVAAEKNLVKHYPLKRLGNPQEIADAAIYLGSDRSSYVTGHSIVVDGGLSVYVGDLI